MAKLKNFSFLKLTGASAVLIIALVILAPFSARALSISPVRYEISGDPGQVLEEQLNLRNETSAPETYYPNYYNFEAQGETGVPSFVKPTDGLGTWMAGPAGITLQPGDNQTIVFVISIPKDAHPGGYFGALLYGTTPPNTNGAQLAVSSETGPIILLRVNGDIKESASILEFGVKNNQKFFTALPVEMFYRFQNTGADRTKPAGNLIIKSILGITAEKQNSNPTDGNVLPGQIRRFELAWQKSNAPTDPGTYASRSFFEQIGYEWNNFAFGYFTAHLDLTYGTNNTNSAEATTKFFVFPWQLLIVIVLVLFIICFILKTLIKRYNRWIIKQAEMALERAQETNQNKEKETLKRTI